MKFKYLISDMDGVLIDTERLVFEMFKKSAAYYGFEFREDIFIKTIGIDSKGSRAIMEKYIPVDYDMFYAKRESYFVNHLNTIGAPVIKNAEESLSKIKESGMKIALATSTDKKRAYFRLEKTNLLSHIDKLAFGDEVENGKPAPDIFLLAAKRLEASPSDCVVFEDSPAGIQAAKSAGMHAVMIPNIKPPDNDQKKMADYVANDILDAVSYVLT